MGQVDLLRKEMSECNLSQAEHQLRNGVSLFGKLKHPHGVAAPILKFTAVVEIATGKHSGIVQGERPARAVRDKTRSKDVIRPGMHSDAPALRLLHAREVDEQMDEVAVCLGTKEGDREVLSVEAHLGGGKYGGEVGFKGSDEGVDRGGHGVWNDLNYN